MLALAWNPVKELKVIDKRINLEPPMAPWNPVKELKVFPAPLSQVDAYVSGIRWNPVKELKEHIMCRIIFSPPKWNPVKELKVLCRPERHAALQIQGGIR